MGCIGVLFAVPEETVEHIRSLPMAERPVFISETLEDEYFDDYPERTAEVEDMWDAIHRSLTDGSLCFDCRQYPLGGVILGGEILYFDGEKYDDYIITAKRPLEVAGLAGELEKLSKAKFKKGYDLIGDDHAGEKSRADMEQAYEFLEDIVPFYRLAAEQGLWVLFTAEQ